MATVVTQPKKIKSSYLKQIIELIRTGGEVKTSKDDLKRYLLRADLIAYELQGGKIICTATLKNPFSSYKTKVFNSAKAVEKLNYKKELGYIATHPDFEGKGHCTKLLKQFFGQISTNLIYATTRKPAMVHILSKFNFLQAGKTYNKDLKLLTYNGTK
jgi:hypothetical protein